MKNALIIVILSLAGTIWAENYGGGTGTAGDPFQIWTPEQMNTIGLNSGDWGSHFKLMADIDMSAYTGVQYNIVGNLTTKFTGSFDGNGYIISNLSYKSTEPVSYVGVFGYTSYATIQNLGVENVDINGTYCVGGLVGRNFNSTLVSCNVSGLVNGTHQSNHVGGLVGSNKSGSVLVNCYAACSVKGTGYCVGGLVGNNEFNCSLTSCYATGSVFGVGEYSYVGGLVGYNEYGSVLTACYATGTVSGSGVVISSVGGLVGTNDFGSLVDCYATGSVSGNGEYSYVGGFIGENYEGSLARCYSVGLVNGTGDYIGGLVGRNNNGTTTACFWDILTSGQTTSFGGIGKTTTEMKTFFNFTLAGWDFVDVWGIGNRQTYPYLKPLTGINIADINFSGKVDLEDLMIMAAHWLED